MPQFETTTAVDLAAAGFEKQVDYGRIELYSGRRSNGDGVMKLFDSKTGRAIEVGGEALNPMQTTARIVGLGVLVLELINRPELNLPAAAKAGFTASVVALLEG